MAPSSLSLPLLVEERSGITRFDEPVTVGIPLPPSAVMHPDKLVLLDQKGQPSLLQSQVLARWFDGSVKWVLLDFQMSIGAYERVSYQAEVIWYSLMQQASNTSCMSGGRTLQPQDHYGSPYTYRENYAAPVALS